MQRILVTGVGGPAAISFINALAEEPVVILAADIDPHAAGLYLVPSQNRVLVPRGDDPNFASFVLRWCRDNHIDVLVPHSRQRAVTL